VHPGFSVFAGPPVDPSQLQSLESQARYITRPAIAMDSLKTRPDGSLVLQTPPDPRTGQTSIALDPLEWIHRITAHIPERGQHTRRSYGAYSNRSRVTAKVTRDFARPTAQPSRVDEDSEFAKETRRTWARLLAKILKWIRCCVPAALR